LIQPVTSQGVTATRFTRSGKRRAHSTDMTEDRYQVSVGFF
jgi:hypothetical protein